MHIRNAILKSDVKMLNKRFLLQNLLVTYVKAAATFYILDGMRTGDESPVFKLSKSDIYAASH